MDLKDLRRILDGHDEVIINSIALRIKVGIPTYSKVEANNYAIEYANEFGFDKDLALNINSIFFKYQNQESFNLNEDIYKGIERIIFSTISTRMSFINDVAIYKLKHEISQYKGEREEEIISLRSKQAELLGIPSKLGEEVMHTIIRYAHKIEEKILD